MLFMGYTVAQWGYVGWWYKSRGGVIRDFESLAKAQEMYMVHHTTEPLEVQLEGVLYPHDRETVRAVYECAKLAA